jgi:hypothetical protein
VIRRIALVVAVVVLAAVTVWIPREEFIAADAPIEESPHGVELRAERTAAVAPFVERWNLSYPATPAPSPASQPLTLHIGAAAGKTAPGRLTAGAGNPAALLERIDLALGGTAAAGAAPPPAPSLDVQLDLLGDRLSVGNGDVGATIIAGAFVAEPAGAWRVYRLTLGEGGPRCYLGLSAEERAAVLLPRSLQDGPAIHSRFRSLLGRGPAGS